LHIAVPNLTFLAFAVALAGALAGLWIEEIPRSARLVIPLSGGLLSGVALFGLLPELVGEIGWIRGVPVFALGYLVLLLIDHHLHPVCPSCSHDHNHGDCARALHGYTIPLLIAAAVHAFLDGWGLANAGNGTSEAVRLTFPAAVMLHKAPEGLALGVIFRASTKSLWTAVALCVAAEAATPLGGWAGTVFTPHLGTVWTNYPLAAAGGSFLYLGWHAVHAEWKRNGVGRAFIPALAGFFAVAIIQYAIGVR
jgi:zinc transporter ZupT